ncbi:MAG: hypothetical protein IIT72_01370 [Lachnospiraceae bacterium]|nr:hypothetical protein [Lachnospiraceae bacterium]MBQ2576493.1 hypothetical protein [Lachnospiraceae bacterium]MBQ5484126.1 hypothetical protein [Lachnospiraceae bacterium]MEE3355940.1 hypothetical protein [Candidatus Weimeria sp.]
MIDQRRVIQMTRMALQEKRAGHKIESVSDLGRKDYVSYHGVRAFFSGTVIYALLYFLVLGILFSTVLVKINNLWFVSLLTIGIIGYLIFLLIYLNRERRIALADYQEYHKALGQLQKEWDKLEEIYEDEERKQTSLNGGEAIAEKIREADKADEV